jgi:hypothetical protein
MSLLLALLHSLRLGEACLFLASVALQTRLTVGAPACAVRLSRPTPPLALPAPPDGAQPPQLDDAGAEAAPAAPEDVAGVDGAAAKLEAAERPPPLHLPPLPPQPARGSPHLARALAASAAAAAGSPAVAAAARALGGAVMSPSLGIASVALLGVHLLAEGSRWQLLPLYLATGARRGRMRRARARAGRSMR